MLCLCIKVLYFINDSFKLNDFLDCVADEFLTFAFTRCHKSSTKNKRMTLIYLLPVKMLLVSQ